MTLFTQDTQPDFWKHFVRWVLPVGGVVVLLAFLVKPKTPVAPASGTNQQVDQGAGQRTDRVDSSQPWTARLPQLPSTPAQIVAGQGTAVSDGQTSPRPTPGEKVSPLPSIKPIAPLKAPAPSQKSPALTLRVAIARDVDSLTVAASTSATVLDTQGRGIGKMPVTQALVAQPDGSGLRLGQWQAPAVWLQPTGNGAIYVGERWYRGKVLLVREGTKLLAVNHVDLDQYLYSVVGGEMPAYWPLEALKAQAIAARSYALVHMIRPAHSLYDLGSTTRWQQYEGIQAEANTTQAAVNQTRGLLLSYQGGVVESMYAASDQIVTDIFGGKGMSQNGAHKLAAQGYDYLHILGAYYPGTGLSRLQAR